MKHVLCFGDSNTHGANPDGGPRFDLSTRWPGVLRRELGEGWWVIEEGCGGRTTVLEDPTEAHRNGSLYLPACLSSHKPLDLVILLLGTNDLKHFFGLNAAEIARGAGSLVDLCRESQAGPDGATPRVLLLAPPPLAPLLGTRYGEMFAGGEEKSRQLGREYASIARDKGCDFLDLEGIVRSSPLDGIHWETAEHAKLGRVVAEAVGRMFS